MSEVRQFHLSDNSILYHISTDIFKSSFFCVNFLYGGTWRDARDVKLLFDVMSKGSVSYPTLMSVNRRLDDLYSTNLSALHSANHLSYFSGYGAEMLDARYITDGTDVLSGALEMINELTDKPLTDEEGRLSDHYIQLVLNEYMTRARNIYSVPKMKATERFYEKLAASNDYYMTGKIYTKADEVKDYDSDKFLSLLDVFRNRTKRVYGYLGTETPESVISKIESNFSPAARCDIAPFDENVFSFDGVAPFEISETDPLANQSQLIMGFLPSRHFDDNESEKVKMFSVIFGNSPSSRLFTRVREKMGLCYDISSDFQVKGSLMTVDCGLASVHIEKARGEILKILEDMAKGDVTEDELTETRNLLKNDLLMVRDSPVSWLGFTIREALSGKNRAPEEVMEELDRVTKEDIAQIAGAYVNRFNYTLLGKKNGEETGQLPTT